MVYTFQLIFEFLDQNCVIYKILRNLYDFFWKTNKINIFSETFGKFLLIYLEYINTHKKENRFSVTFFRLS